jgi:hypothetical protein
VSTAGRGRMAPREKSISSALILAHHFQLSTLSAT